MRKTGLALLLLALLFHFTGSRAQIILADFKNSDYKIIVPALAAPQEHVAALEFQRLFCQVASVTLPVISDDQPVSGKEIVIGNSNRLGLSKIKTGLKPGASYGFMVQTKDEKLFITGGSPSGTLNGVYAFFEKYLGCRYYAPGDPYIPKRPKVILPGIKDRQVPEFTFRELLFPARNDTAYRQWHKLQSHSDGSWGMWVHTFDDLVPPQTYFSSHPEYFSEINGKRTPDGQLCLSNPEVFDVLAANLRKKMEAKPGAIYWSVSQNDNFLSCQCDECKKIAARYGGESGLMIWFVNRVAALFPDRVISTLAYQYTRSAPEHIKPLPNVNIMLCSIECNRSQPLADDPSSASFVSDVKEWTKLTNNILIWDYVVQFRNYISPFPNLRVLQPNLEFFADNGCRMMFQQGSGSSLSEFVDLRAYMIAKLLWDPGLNADEIMKDFIYGYYGNAAQYIYDYINMLHDELEVSGDNLWIYGYPYSGIKSFLKPEMIPVYSGLFDEAEKAAVDDPVILDRVLYARLPLDFAILDISLHNAGDDLTWFDEDNGRFIIKEKMVNLLDTFVNRCKRLNVNTLNEQRLAPEDYRLKVKQYLLKIADRHLAIGKPVEMLTAFSPKYEVGGAAALTDGLRGINDYHFNWLGFEGSDLEAVIDLGSEMPIHEIRADFIQDIQSWVFLPRSFTAYYSNDGQSFTLLGSDQNITPDNKTGAFIQTFSVPAENITARYVKVKAISMKTCPSWHIGAGISSWIFTDEIVIK